MSKRSEDHTVTDQETQLVRAVRGWLAGVLPEEFRKLCKHCGCTGQAHYAREASACVLFEPKE